MRGAPVAVLLDRRDARDRVPDRRRGRPGAVEHRPLKVDERARGAAEVKRLRRAPRSRAPPGQSEVEGARGGRRQPQRPRVGPRGELGGAREARCGRDQVPARTGAPMPIHLQRAGQSLVGPAGRGGAMPGPQRLGQPLRERRVRPRRARPSEALWATNARTRSRRKRSRPSAISATGAATATASGVVPPRPARPPAAPPARSRRSEAPSRLPGAARVGGEAADEPVAEPRRRGREQLVAPPAAASSISPSGLPCAVSITRRRSASGSFRRFAVQQRPGGLVARAAPAAAPGTRAAALRAVRRRRGPGGHAAAGDEQRETARRRLQRLEVVEQEHGRRQVREDGSARAQVSRVREPQLLEGRRRQAAQATRRARSRSPRAARCGRCRIPAQHQRAALAWQRCESRLDGREGVAAADELGLGHRRGTLCATTAVPVLSTVTEIGSGGRPSGRPGGEFREQQPAVAFEQRDQPEHEILADRVELGQLREPRSGEPRGGPEALGDGAGGLVDEQRTAGAARARSRRRSPTRGRPGRRRASRARSASASLAAPTRSASSSRCSCRPRKPAPYTFQWACFSASPRSRVVQSRPCSSTPARRCSPSTIMPDGAAAAPGQLASSDRDRR